jgi:hypothetical protein
MTPERLDRCFALIRAGICRRRGSVARDRRRCGLDGLILAGDPDLDLAAAGRQGVDQLAHRLRRLIAAQGQRDIRVALSLRVAP